MSRVLVSLGVNLRNRLLKRPTAQPLRYLSACPVLGADSSYQVPGLNVPARNLKLSQPIDHVIHLEINRPKTRNAFDLETAQELTQVLDGLEKDPAVRCVLLSGSESHFTSGVDVKSFLGVWQQLQETEDVSRRSRLLLDVIQSFQAPFKRMYLFGKPIVCVLHGYCYGLGVELAACSDIRFASGDLRLAPREVLIGIAADVGSLQEMPRLVSNQSLLRELLYTGRDASAQEALALDFVSQVLPDKITTIARALELAGTIAERSPVAVQGTKRNLRVSRDKSFLDGLDYNAVWNMSMMQSSDLARAVEAILTKSELVKFDDF